MIGFQSSLFWFSLYPATPTEWKIACNIIRASNFWSGGQLSLHISCSLFTLRLSFVFVGDNVKTWKNRIPEKHFFLSGEFYRRHKLSRHLPKESTSWPFIINFTFYWYNNGFSLYWCSSLPHLRLPLPKKMYGQVSIVLYKNVIKTIKDFMAYRRLPEFLWNGLRDSRFATRNKKLREIPKKLRATRRHNCNTNDISEVRNNIHVFQFGQIEQSLI